MSFAEKDRNGVSLGYWSGLFPVARTEAEGSRPVHHVEHFLHALVPMLPQRGSRGKKQVVHVGPIGSEHLRRERPAVEHGSGPAMKSLRGLEHAAVQPHGHENGYRVFGNADPVVPQIEGVIFALDRGDGDVHPLGRPVRGVVDAVGAPLPAGRSGRTLNRGGPPVDGELGLIVEDDVHLLHPVVEMVADASPGMQHSPVDEQEVRGQGIPSQEGHVGHLTGAAMDGLYRPQGLGRGVSDPFRKGLLLGRGRSEEQK